MGQIANIVDQACAETTGIVSATTAYEINFTGCGRCSYQLNFTVTTPSAKVVPSSDISAAADTFTLTNHGLVTGLKGQFTTSGGLPTNISLATDYFIIRVDANVFKVATSLANALAGTNVDLGTAGTGNQTFTPTALAGASVKLQKSNGKDGASTPATMWSDEGSATNITTTATVFLADTLQAAKNYRISIAITAGQLTVSGRALGKGTI